MNKTFAPFAKPMYVMLKSVGSACNLKCEYCYYLEKENLYPSAKGQLMSDALLEKFTEQYINSQTQNEILFTWHDGEPGLNYLCAGWKMFYNHVAPYMDFMKNELMHERPPANVMEWARNRKVR